MSEQVIRAECKICKSTGLVVDAYCHDGVAKICRNCKGEGYKNIYFTQFFGRKPINGISLVFQNIPFQHIYPGTHTFPDGTTINFRESCVPYEEWKKGTKPPSPEHIDCTRGQKLN